MIKKGWIVAMLGAAAMAMSAAAMAQSRMQGWYVGAEVGNAEFSTTDDTSFKFLGGYQINRTFAAEAAYAMLLDNGGTEVTAMELAGVASFPIANRFSAFGKLGLANIESEAAGQSADDTELTFGFGVQYDVSPNLGIRGQWQRYNTDNEVDVLSVGVVYKF
jgi:OOP family OmpA-OmpF porin